IYPVPEATSAAICNFPDMDSAVQCVIHMMQVGVQIGRVEFIDAMGVKAVNNYSKLGLEETPLLVFEFNGSPNAVKEQIELVRELALELGGKDFKWAHKQEERNELWRARHNLYFACLQLRPGSRSITTDVCVPISRLADCVLATAEDLKEVAFPWSILGHVGDGNFHVLMMIDPNSDSERQIAESINQSLVNRAIEMEGT